MDWQASSSTRACTLEAAATTASTSSTAPNMLDTCTRLTSLVRGVMSSWKCCVCVGGAAGQSNKLTQQAWRVACCMKADRSFSC
jgi:hypothetical protein